MEKRIVFLVSLFGLLNASQAGDSAQIQGILHPGDVIAVHESYCKEEQWLRHLFKTERVTGINIAFDLIQRQWGWDACLPNNGIRYNGQETQGVYLDYSNQAIFLYKERRWIIKVELDDNIIFTHLSDVQLETIRKERPSKASAATN